MPVSKSIRFEVFARDAFTCPNSRVLTPWINTYGVEEVERSIKIATIAYTSGRFGFDEERAFNKLLPYVGAILRNRRTDKESGAIQ